LAVPWVFPRPGSRLTYRHTVVPPRTLWAGVPAKLHRELSEKDRARIQEYAQKYPECVEIHLAETARYALPNDSIPET